MTAPDPLATQKEPEHFSLGGFGPTLAEQGMGAVLSADDLMHFQRDDEAISRLFQRGLIPYTAHIKAREKLAAKIRAAVAKRQSGAADV